MGHIKQSLLLSTFIAGVFFAPLQAKAAEFNAEQKAAIGDIIKDYLMENPQVIFDAVDAHRAKQEEEQRKQAQTAIEDNLKILTAADAPSVGPADADITVVEFFDYNCGYCKKALPGIQ
ncbi:MAG: DsbA family protein, partial [Bdellovibrionales bacterium]